MRVLVTGAGGFIGRALCRRLARDGRLVLAAVRDPGADAGLPRDVRRVAIPDAGIPARALDQGVDAVVHLASRVHRMSESDREAARAEYQRVNVDWTRDLALAAARAGANRFVFMSTVKVHGESREEPYTEADIPNPRDPYARSKWDAEQELEAIARKAGLETVILRPPLVYGPEVGANFLRLLGLAKRELPLPLGRLNNARSLIHLDNLTDAVSLCLDHPGAAGAWLVSDGTDFSTPELLRTLARAMGRRTRLFPLPIPLLRAGFAILGKSGMFERLCGSLRVDPSRIRLELGWNPPVSPCQGLEDTAQWFLGSRNLPRGGDL
jgi:nucleoside-diphosphate-sugar epimerase